MFGTLTLPAECSSVPAQVLWDDSLIVSPFPVFGLTMRLGNFVATLGNPVSAKWIT
jgi:hypothetical protein